MTTQEKGARLGTIENGVYFLTWVSAVFYSIYNVYLSKKFFTNYYDFHRDFRPGWSWLGGSQDTADHEWNTWIPLLIRLIPWLIAHLIISQFIKYKTQNKMVLCSWYIFISLHFLYHYVGFLGILLILIQPCISCFLLSINSRTVSWTTQLITLMLINYAKYSETVYQYFAYLEIEEYIMLLTVVCWTQLRSISYVMDSSSYYQHVGLRGFFQDLVQNTAYNLYLPNLFLGPIILYSEFVQGINRNYLPWTLKKLFRTLLNLLRFVFWLYFTEFALHFVYVNALQYHPEILSKMNPWAFYGFGYCMGQYFLNKYVVIYGIGGELIKADNIDAPPHPKCIGRIHLYSDMWKHFDVGLYKFLLRYIYFPMTANSKSLFRNLFASFLCFSFVFMWHGVQQFIFIWSILNFIGLAIEGVAKNVGQSSKYKKFVNKYLNPKCQRRFHCALAAPLLMMSAVSNFYFFGGSQVGHLFVYRLIHESPFVIIVLLISLYCCCQVSTDIKINEKK